MVRYFIATWRSRKDVVDDHQENSTQGRHNGTHQSDSALSPCWILAFEHGFCPCTGKPSCQREGKCMAKKNMSYDQLSFGTSKVTWRSKRKNTQMVPVMAPTARPSTGERWYCCPVVFLWWSSLSSLEGLVVLGLGLAVAGC